MISLKQNHILLLFLCYFALNTAIGQDRFDQLRITMEAMVVDAPGLDEQIEFSTNKLSLKEFIRGVGIAHELNVSVDEDLNDPVANNFSNAKVLEVFVFLCKTHNLDINFTNNILHFERFIPLVEKKMYVPKVIYNETDSLFTLDLENDTLGDVILQITALSPYTALMTQELKDKLVSIYIEEQPFRSIIEQLALTNEMAIENVDVDSYLFTQIPQKSNHSEKSSRKEPSKAKSNSNFILNEDGTLSGSAFDMEYHEIIDEVSSLYGFNYFLFNQIKGKGHLEVSEMAYEEFMTYLLNGSSYTFKKVDDVYLFGDRKLEGLRHTELIPVDNRVVDEMIEMIPADLKTNIDIKVFNDLNAFILSGSALKITELKRFIRSIDQVVPMIGIELMIVDVNKTNLFSAGMQASFGSDNAPANSSGISGSGGLNVTLNSNSINTMITNLNGFGAINLGQVTPDFYVNLEALESQGYIKTRQRTKLSALNGEDAEISIGNTEYYLEVRNDIIGTQNPVQSQTQNWKAVNADLAVNIKPVVSNDGQVVLEVTVTQKDFTARVSETAPPGNVSRTFKSMIRVKDGDMVLLGGLEEKKLSKNRSGLPLLSKIPVIRWFFGKETREKSTSTLNIFLKPMVYY